jgi:Trypsin-like peptidase domain
MQALFFLPTTLVVPAGAAELDDGFLPLTEQEIAAREAELGIERVYLDATQYYYVGGPPPPADGYQTRGPVTWRYDGQEVFSDVSEPDPGLVWFEEPLTVLTGLEFDPETYLGVGYGLRVDTYGRRWVVDAVDLPAAEAKIDASAGPVLEATDADDTPGIDFLEGEREGAWVELTSWSTTTCGGTTHFWTHDGNGPMTQFSATALPVLEPARQTVFIRTPNGIDCSGVLVAGSVAGESAVLTAAHCVTGSAGNPGNPAMFSVCVLENLDRNDAATPQSTVSEPDCVPIDDILPCPNWVGDNPYEVEHDYALLLLGDDPAVGALDLAVDSGAFEDDPDFHFGSPFKDLQCQSNTVDDFNLTADDAQPGRYLWESTGEVQSAEDGWMKWDTSTCRGCSGGPHLACDDGLCDADPVSGEPQARVTGIQTLRPQVNGAYAGGPKASDLRQWVFTHITDPNPEQCDGPMSASDQCDCPQYRDTLRCKWDHAAAWDPYLEPVRAVHDSPITSPAEDFTLVRLFNEDVRCADGTMPGIYVDPANDPQSNRWLFYLEGGGGCAPVDTDGDGIVDLSQGPDPEEQYCGFCYVDPASCAVGPAALARDEFGSGLWAPSMDFFGVMADSADNDHFRDFHRVHIQKCTVDRYLGRAKWEGAGGMLELDANSEGLPIHVNFYNQGYEELVLVFDDLRDGLGYWGWVEGSSPPAVAFELLPPLEDAEQILVAGTSGGANGLVHHIDTLGLYVRSMNENIDFRAIHDSALVAGVENEVVFSQDLTDPPLPGCGWSCDAYDHVWAGHTDLTATTGMTYDLGTAEAYYLELEGAKLATWSAVLDQSCLVSHPTGSVHCRNPAHVLMNHVSTPMFIHQDLTDHAIPLRSVPGFNRAPVEWAECDPTSPGCAPTWLFPSSTDPGDPREHYVPRLAQQVDTLFTQFPSRSELADGSDPSLGGGPTPTIYGFFPSCTVGNHVNVDDDYLFNVNVPIQYVDANNVVQNANVRYEDQLYCWSIQDSTLQERWLVADEPSSGVAGFGFVDVRVGNQCIPVPVTGVQPTLSCPE